jgi:hypothetical protein
VRLLSAWEEFGRFTRECCGVEPLTLLRAWRLLAADPAAEVRQPYPKVERDAEAATGWYASLGGAWRKRFDGD